jgi:hypothetical protein
MAPFKQTTLPAHLKPGMGRPSEYKPEYCQQIIEAMSNGISLTAFAGMIGVSKQAVYEWIGLHRDFGDAASRAKAARVLWWERKLMRSRKGAETTASIFALRNADPTEWRDIKSVQHDHNHRLESLTDAQLYAIAAGQSAGDGVTIDGEYEDISPHANAR